MTIGISPGKQPDEQELAEAASGNVYTPWRAVLPRSQRRDLEKRQGEGSRSTDREALRDAAAYEVRLCRVLELGPGFGWAISAGSRVETARHT